MQFVDDLLDLSRADAGKVGMRIERFELAIMGAPWGGASSSANLQFTRGAEGLVVTFPEKKQTEYVYTLEISGSGLVKA